MTRTFIPRPDFSAARAEERKIRFVNDAGEAIPPFALIELCEIDTIEGGVLLYKAKKPIQGKWIFARNGPVNIGTGRVGVATMDWPGYVLVQPGNTPSCGENWGAIDGQWYIAKEDDSGNALFGFDALGDNDDDDGSNERTLVVPYHPRYLKCKPDQDITPSGSGGSGTVSIWQNDADTGRNVEGFLNWGHADEKISKDKECMVQWYRDENGGKGRWVFYFAECED